MSLASPYSEAVDIFNRCLGAGCYRPTSSRQTDPTTRPEPSELHLFVTPHLEDDRHNHVGTLTTDFACAIMLNLGSAMPWM